MPCDRLVPGYCQAIHKEKLSPKTRFELNGLSDRASIRTSFRFESDDRLEWDGHSEGSSDLNRKTFG